MIFLTKSLFNSVGSFSLFVLSLYFPLFFFIYSPGYHLSKLPEIKRTEVIGQNKTIQAVKELYGFFRHGNSLTLKEWSKKELQHLKEVRKWFDILGCLFLLSILFLTAARKRINVTKISFGNGVALVLLGILLSVDFTFFWKQVFHPLLFKNDFWKNTPNDLSYYLMPRSFFKGITLWVCFFSLVFHFSLSLFLIRKNNHS